MDNNVNAVKKDGKKKNNFKSNEMIMMVFVLVLVILIFTVLNKNYFTYANMSNILMAASTIGLLAIGETFLIIAGHVDLSCANIAAMSAVITAILINGGMSWPLAIVLVAAGSTIAGLLNSCLVNVFELQPFIATLATSNVFMGVAYLACSGKSLPVGDKGFNAIGSMRILGIPFPAVLMVVCFVIFGFILARTIFGRSVYMVGGNAEAARLAGLNPKMVSTILYVISAVLAAFAGVLMTAKMHSGQPSAGSGAEFDAITAAILGGVAFTGGTGNLAGCFIGLLIMQCFNNGLTVINVSSFWQIVAKGLLLIVALLLDFIRRKKVFRKFLEILKAKEN